MDAVALTREKFNFRAQNTGTHTSTHAHIKLSTVYRCGWQIYGLHFSHSFPYTSHSIVECILVLVLVSKIRSEFLDSNKVMKWTDSICFPWTYVMLGNVIHTCFRNRISEQIKHQHVEAKCTVPKYSKLESEPIRLLYRQFRTRSESI